MRRFSRSKFQLERQDNGLTAAVDEGYIYQSGHGHYTHQKFLNLDETITDNILKTVRRILSKAQRDGEDALNLRIDVYNDGEFEQDYFVIRHIVREFGISQGIFFNGKSGADTVSLDENFSLKSQGSSILDFFRKEGRPLDKKDVAAIIRSQSVNHAGFYINELMEDGLLIRINNTQYDLPERAFADASVTLIFEIAERLLNRAEKIVETGVIASDCNTRLHLSYNKVWYFSLLRHFAERLGKSWHFSGTLISTEPLPYRTLAAMVRSTYQPEDSMEQITEKMRQQLMVDNTTLYNAIKNVTQPARSCRG